MKIKPAVRRRIEQSDSVPSELREEYPRLHYCPDWNFMLINDDEPEFESCFCYYHDGRHWYFPKETNENS